MGIEAVFLKKNIKVVLVLCLISLNQGCNESTATVAPVDGVDPDLESSSFDPSYQFHDSESKVQDRNFYLFSLLEKYELGLSIENSLLNNYRVDQFMKMDEVANSTAASPERFCTPFHINDDSKLTLNKAFEVVMGGSSIYAELVAEMRTSGAFIQFQEVKSDARYFQLALGEAIDGINNIIDVYGLGNLPLYPDIDSGDYNTSSSQYRTILENIFANVQLERAENDFFIYPSLQFALELLKANQRDEAGRYFPMQLGVNKRFFDLSSSIDWDNYDYAMILVLGDSPNSVGDFPNISIGGMKRADQGVKLWREGLAPVIAFSGGHLHPVHTPFSEAIEMKKYIMDVYNVPENVIIVDPHARHTTTNIRNIGRMMYRYGIPTDKLSIVSTSESHSEYLESDRFKTRSVNEMNHIPCTLFNRLSGFDLEFQPRIEVLHLDATDPLDP